MTTRIFIWLLWFALCLHADEVDRIVNEEMRQQHIPGVSVGVMRDGRLIKARGYGYANLELSVPVTSDTVFAIGSISKQFIAAGILLLVQDGKLNVDDRVSQYLEDAPPSWSAITIRHLLTHTSGLVRESPDFQYIVAKPDIDLIRKAYSVALEFPAGARYQYCNLGFFILAEIMHRLAGKPWPEFLNDRIFAPLEMESTRTTTHLELVRNRASSYDWKEERFVHAPALLTVRPSGALLSNVIDIAKWDAALYGGGPLSEESKKQSWTPLRLNDGNTYPYGFGWALQPYKGHRGVQHGGSLQGFTSYFQRLPEDRLSVVVLTNGRQAKPGRIVERIADEYLNRGTK